MILTHTNDPLPVQYTMRTVPDLVKFINPKWGRSAVYWKDGKAIHWSRPDGTGHACHPTYFQTLNPEHTVEIV